MTRPSYDPMRAPAPAFPRHRLTRVLPEDRVAELAASYELLDYEGRVHFARQVTSAPDERLQEVTTTLVATPPPPPEPVPADSPEAPAVNQAAAQAAPVPPTLPVPAEQLPQLRVPELQAVAEQVGVAKSGTKAELVDRITAATGEQPAITPEQIAADAPAAETTGQPPAPAAADGQGAVETADGQTATGSIPADAASAPQDAPAAPAQPDTPAATPQPADGQQAAPAAPAAPAAGTTTDGGQPA